MAESAIILQSYTYTMEEAFPNAPIPISPFGSRVLIQLRRPPLRKGLIELTQHSKDREQDIAQVGKVLAFGPGAFLNRTTGQPWHEGRWCEVGSIVCVPRYGGDRWMEKQADGTEIQFGLFNDLDLVGLILGDPLAVRTFI